MIMSSENLKTYEFDEKLCSMDIQFIDRFEINRLFQEIRCDRCNACLKYINDIRIEDDNYNIGDFCYESILKILAEIRGKSVELLRIELERGYLEYVRLKRLKEIEDRGEIDKFDPDFKLYETMKWDVEHGGIPEFQRKEYEELKKKFES